MSQVAHQMEVNTDQPQLHETGVAGTYAKEEPSNQEPDWRSHIRRREDVSPDYPTKFKKGDEAWRKVANGEEMILTIVEIQLDINDAKIVYSVQDTDGKLVTDAEGREAEWIPEDQLKVWD